MPVDTQWLDALVTRIRASPLYAVTAAGGGVLAVTQRGATVAQISRRTATVTFPFRGMGPVATLRQTLLSFPGMRQVGGSLVLTVDSEAAAAVAERYLKRRSRIERYAWQSRELGP